jgi:hypothetical protein
MFRHPHVRSALLSGLAVLLLLMTSAGAVGASASQTAPASCAPAIGFASVNFPNPTVIDNTWFRLIPGTQYTLKGQANRGGGLLPHEVIFTVTDLTKVIDGVRTVVIWDRDFNEGELVEAELSFFAQDKDRNVWNLGEYPEEYEGGQFTGAPSTWISGLAGAEGGLHMLANPRTGTSWYLQGSAPAIEFLDCAKVAKTGETICVPFGCYNDVLVTDETSPLDQGGGHQLKYHAPGVGIIQVGAVADKEGETLVLTGLVRLGQGGLAEAHREALKLDKHGYVVSPDVYGKTPHAE